MKKILLFALISFPLCQASAQLKTSWSTVQLAQNPRRSLAKSINAPAALAEPGTALKTAAADARWYNHAQQMAAYDGVSANLYTDELTSGVPLWQDSSVRYVDNNGAATGDGISWLSAAEIFAPNTILYNSNTVSPVNNRGKLRITTESYTIDSVMVRGYYDRRYNYDDTLILTFVADSTKGIFSGDAYDVSVLTDHGVDSFADILYNAPDFLARPINQVSYHYGSSYLKNAVQKKIPLTQLVYNDSLADGSQQIRAAVGIDVPGSAAGGRIAMSVTFKSGTHYTAGQPITAYNNFSLMSHETVAGDFQKYLSNDYNMSYLVSKDTTETSVGAGLNIYIPTIAFSSPDFPYEIHDISWKASCASCNKVSVGETSPFVVGKAYPNPAKGTLQIPITVSNAAVVHVSISNMLGQTLESQTFNLGAGQSKIATFTVSELSGGVYTYTIESEGLRSSDHVLIAR